jgi:hypothetical protein
MLVVGPGSLTLPMPASLVVSTPKTVFVPASNAATRFRLGDKTIRPGELPALIEAIRGRVSFFPLTITSAGKVAAVETPWDAKTRSVKPLGGPVFVPPPHEIKFIPAQSPTTRTRMRFFKRQAPNDKKKVDLTVKSEIITDRRGWFPDAQRSATPSRRRMRETASILYSLQ